MAERLTVVQKHASPSSQATALPDDERTPLTYIPRADDILQSFGVTRTLGFLRKSVERLPNEYAPWERLSGSLTSLLSVGAMRKAVAKLPLLDMSGLGDDERLLARAKLLLTTITQSYVFGQAPTIGELPPQLAKPLCEISRALDVPPILSYSDYVLGNWRLINRDLPLSLDNLQIRIGLNGGTDEAWFILVHVAIEAEAGEIVGNCVDARLAAESQDVNASISTLARLTESINQMERTFLRMRERCDPYVYFLRVRPFTHGWHNNPAFDGGMIYEGVGEFEGAPMSFRGETGAQSSVIPSVDATLGVKHPQDKLNEHLVAMRDYMPREHRKFLDWMEGSTVREFVFRMADNESAGMSGEKLLLNYNACCESLREFRTTHLQMAHDYVYAHRGTVIDSAANSASVGTGGTPPMDYLRHHRDATDESIISGRS